MKRFLMFLTVALVVGLLMLALAVPAFAEHTGGPPGPPASDIPSQGDEHVSDAGEAASCDGQDPHTAPAFGDHGAPGSPTFEALHGLWHDECDPTDTHPNGDGSLV